MDKGGVDRLVAAHKSAERQHERARRVHLRAEAFYRREGERARADRERRLAERQQRGAEIERERLRALLSGDERAYLRARDLRMPALPDGPGAGIDEAWTSVLHRAEERHLIAAEREADAAERELAADDSGTASLSRHERLTGEEEGPECERRVARAEQAEIDREMAHSEREMLTQLRGQGRSGNG